MEKVDDAATLHEGLVASTTTDTPPDVAGYACVRVIGRGGMGVVWEAIELRLDRHVALKVARETSDVATMWDEAKLAAHVNDAGVVTVLDVGKTLDGRPYYTMELVDGTDLAAVLRDGKLGPTEAVRIACEVAQAVGAAHDRGIVHRDLKPRNVMIDKRNRARVLDFGLALRHATAETPQTFAGSPPYMAPEQIRTQPISPQTDVYAIGVMLYEMLAGRRPFDAPEQPALLYAILFEPPPSLSAIAGVPTEVAGTVARCLAKDPAARFASAHELADVLAALRDGTQLPRERERAPRKPRESGIVTKAPKPTRDQAQRVFKWSWSFKSSPEALWPHVADTDCFNEAVGLGPVDVELARESPDTTARVGHARAIGLEMRWREYPFEWIRNREHTVFRWYREGPLEALWNRVELHKRADGGTDLTHEIAIIPRGVLGRVAALVEIGQRLRRAMDRVYRHVDEVISTGTKGDPYESRHEPSSAERVRIEVGEQKLVDAGFERNAVEVLGQMLRHAPSRKLARMRPFALAAQFRVSRERALELMLHAAHIGLLEIAWDLVCPTCMVAHDTRSHLGEITSHAQCVSCETEYDRDLGSSVELVLRPHPDVRTTKVETFCAGSPARRSHVLVQLVLDPGEERSIVVQLPPGEYSIAAFGIASLADLAVSPVGFTRVGEIVVDERTIVARPSVFGAEGEMILRFVNDTPEERSVRIEKREARADSVPATLALTHPTFRDFFASELLSYGQLLGVSHLYFVAVDASDRGALFVDRGDAAACASLRGFEETFERSVRDEGGARLPGPLETMVAAFPSGSRALRAALALLDHAGALPVRAAIHGGRCLALTREARIEYFGETLHRALWLASAAAPRELVLSQVAAGDRDLAIALHGALVDTRVDVATSGLYEGRRIVRVALRRAAQSRSA